MIGDPSGRTDMRSMMTPETIQHNCDCFKKQMERFIEFGEGKAQMVNNADWLLKLNYIELLREVGACFSVNNMLRAECYKQRMEKGLSFLEFNYMIMQSYDFYYLFQDVRLQHAVRRRRPVVQHAGRHGAHPPEAGQGRLRHDHHPAPQLRGQEDGQDRHLAPCGWTPTRPLPMSSTSTGATWATTMCSSACACSPSCPWKQIDEMDQWEGSSAEHRQGDPGL